MLTSLLTIFVHSDLKSYGPTMDGEDYVAPVFYAVAEDKDGRRWAHFHQFPAAYIVDTPDGFYHANIAEQAEAEAEKLVECMRFCDAVRIEDPQWWGEIEPAYGSMAFMECNEFGGDGAPLR